MSVREKEYVLGSDRKPDFKLSGEMKQILEYSYDGIWITDGQSRILYMNRGNERISGIKREDVLGKYTQELLDQKLFSKSAVLQVLKTCKRVTMMGYNYNTKKHVLITGNPILDKDGNIKYVLNNVRDITDLENMSRKLKNKENIINQQRLEIEQLKALKNDKNPRQRQGIIANSPKMRRVFELVKRVGKFDSTVLILGESGVGKEVVADSVVYYSERSKSPFIKVNCGAIPDNLLESEFFGYEKGAFTGANQKGKIGLFEMANGGTILLDEIAELPLNLQVKILRVLQEKKITRVGGTKPIDLDIRIIAATNKNIEKMVSEGRFREDLFYRLNVVTVPVPPLRERPEDIPALINLFLRKFNKKYNLDKVISTEVIDVFVDYPWPGNVRELVNVIENIVILSQEQQITTQHIPTKIFNGLSSENNKVKVDGILPLKKAVDLLEEELIKKALKKYGTTRKAASVLKVDQSTIVRKMKKFRSDVLQHDS
ncbi:sigma-54 interaction domain-containing protein [Maledivibacter halophilus]|uniref:HTH-type transcriptional regulatory protein TyrR n=1 Tax=Maledivibacter halophilus TaxID=36842 RepID=A0A1T5IAG7_9FIRM|nr:sigma 54-interacting transcriptional regulator [Maledivibacter halophilus]SKC36174.1 PAS domain S-box-containing protein [Maledivibacter halophilus]